MEPQPPQPPQNPIAALEAILFIYGEPMETKKIMKILSLTKEQAEEAVRALAETLERDERGIRLVTLGEKIQLVTKSELAVYVETCVKEELKEQLTPASLETLSLIAYRGPLSRAEIEYYRGVNSTFTLRSLMMRGLIERGEKSEGGQEKRYQISMNMLKYLGLKRVEELPEYETYKTITRMPEMTEEGEQEHAS